MKKYLIYLISVTIVTIIVFILLYTKNDDNTVTNDINEKQTGALISFNEDVHDFGKVKEGPQLEYTFHFTNKGDETLKIIAINTRCGCTAAVPDKTEYLKGENGTLKVTFNTQGRHGIQEKDISITSNDLNNPNKRIRVIADIE